MNYLKNSKKKDTFIDPFMSNENIIIICQAPADVPYVLTIYEETMRKDKLSIYVINVEGIYQFLSELNLKVEKLIFIPYLLTSLKQLHHLPLERARIKRLLRINFSNIDSGIVYFFSRFEDWLTGAFIHKLSKTKKLQIIYANHYDNSSILFTRRDSISLKTKIYLNILRYLTRVQFYAYIAEKLPEFPIENYNIREINPPLSNQVFSKYSYSINQFISDKNNDKRILFLLSPCEETIFEINTYENTILKIFKQFKDLGYKIITKGHPRMGLSITIRNNSDFEIPRHIPGEFIETSHFELCMGIDTTAICHFSMCEIIPTYSLINLFQPKDEKRFESAVEYLKQQTRGKMQFINNFEELEVIAHKI